MLKFGNKEFRNLQEQVLKNMESISNLKEGTAVLSEFGIKVVGEVDTLQDLPSVIDYKTAHEDWEYGDAFAIGTQAPYTLVILTRANDEITTDHWFDIGEFPAPGPQGPAGPQGEVGPQGQTGDTGPAGDDAGFGSILATAQTLPAGSSATATVTTSGPNTAKEFSFTFGIPRGADGANATWGNIGGTLSDQTDLDNALDAKQDTLVSGTNIKTINNQSVVGSGNIEINSGVWGNITGTLSNQTDLQTALNAKANTSSLATVATTGDYDDLIDKPDLSVYVESSDLAGVAFSGDYTDLINKPTIPSEVTESTVSGWGFTKNVGTITDVKVDGSSVVSAGVASITMPTVPTKVSDLQNDSGFITGITSSDVRTALGYTPYDSTNPNGFITASAISDMATQTWVTSQGYSTFSGNYNDLTNKPTIPVVPTNVSAFTNDAGYLISSDLSNYVTTNTWQTISGTKNFTNFINCNDTSGIYIGDSASTGECWVEKDHINFNKTNTYNTSFIPGQLSYTDYGYTGTAYDEPFYISVGTTQSQGSNTNFYGFECPKDGNSHFLRVATQEWIRNQGYSTFSGSYNDLTNKPDLSVYALRSSLSTVATSGSYNDLTNKPSIPTKTSDLNNDSGFITNSDLNSYVPNTRTINNKALSSNISLTASDVGAVSSVTPTTETWTFTLSDGTTTTKTIVTGITVA